MNTSTNDQGVNMNTLEVLKITRQTLETIADQESGEDESEAPLRTAAENLMKLDFSSMETSPEKEELVDIVSLLGELLENHIY
jgi:hypothetical protein